MQDALKKVSRKQKMTAVSFRLDSDVAEWLPDFLDRTSASQTKIGNEAFRRAKDSLEKSLKEGEKLCHPRGRADSPGDQ